MGNERKYTINVGNFTCGEDVYEDRCLCASFGGIGLQTDTIPWEGTSYNPWDYRAEYEMVDTTVSDYDEHGLVTGQRTEQKKQYTGEFVLDVIEIPVVVAPPTEMEQMRADIDYLLMMEG